MSSIYTSRSGGKEANIYDSPTFDQDIRIHVNEAVGSATISPSGRDVALASQQGLHIIDLDSPFSPPRHLRHQTPWTPADVQWSPFASRYYWIVSTSNQRALVWNLELPSSQAPIEHTLHAHTRAITDINFSGFHPDLLATCAVDAYVHCWDLRTPSRPVVSFSDWFAGATQVKWNRQDSHIIASSHDRYLRIWDDRKGALPLKTIEAHETKIYGIDWNRTTASKVITCSLDRTIKLWDYDVSETKPERVIHTPFPVWRARHTPFGCGVLAMPQRGNNDLHLYDRRPRDEATVHSEDETRPDYSFTGHQEPVKEFLWRARGTISNNVDDRDFQLVSWGADRELILHHMGGKQLRAAGHQKGMQLMEGWALTRRGAPYKSFRDRAPLQINRVNEEVASTPNGPGLEALNTGTSPGMNKAPIPIAGGWADGGSTMTYSGMETRNVKHEDKDLITWMKGVRFGKRGPSSLDKRKTRKHSILGDLQGMALEGLPENLSDEIIHVGERFTKVTFEEADVASRHIRVTFNGPWGPESRLIFMQLRMDFPNDYPEASCPRFELDRTSALPEERVADLESDLGTIATGYLIHRRGCIEAVLSYLLGERDLHESTDWLDPLREDVIEEAESSSDDEDGLMGEYGTTGSQNLDMEGSMGSGILSANANVPLPKACGAVWAADGRLVCFFPPRKEPQSILHHTTLADSNRTRDSREIFEGFGRLNTDSPDLRSKGRSMEEIEEDGSDDTSSYSSSSSSSGSEGPDILSHPFQPPSAWHGGSIRFQKPQTHSTNGSIPTSSGINKKTTYVNNRTVISLRNMDDVLPSKRVFAEEYDIFGDAQSLCSHASEVATRYGDSDLANVWELVKLILRNDVPLRELMVPNQKEDVYVLAHRALHRIKRKDSGLDLFFDPQGPHFNPRERAHVKWGNHPFAKSWLVQALFDHFERIADVQMLAMLSCIFAQAVAEDNTDTSSNSPSSKHFPQSMTLPAQSHNYFPSDEIAIGAYEPIISLSVSPKHMLTPGTAFGSTPSSNGFREDERTTSEPVTPFSTGGNTPPMPLSRGSTYRSNTAQSLSTSPDQHRASIPSATSSFAASVWARPFNLASSPPTRNRLSGDELSSSTPSNNVTWGKSTKTVYKSDSTIRKSYVSQGLGDAYDDGSSTEEDEPFHMQVPVKISLKNQDMFDNESCVSVPFLRPEDAFRHVCYREAYAEMLGVWGLTIQQNELLKYNGIVSHALRKRAERDSQSTLTLGADDPAEGVEDGLGPHMPLLASLLDDEEIGCETGCGCACDEKNAVEGSGPFDFDRDLEIEQKLARATDFGNLQGPHHSTIVNRRGSLADSRRAKGFGDRADQELIRGSVRRTRTRSFDH
ncbi:hypothetical protein MBLNU459_g6127t2 [Dothideomycetes sp. NU459]